LENLWPPHQGIDFCVSDPPLFSYSCLSPFCLLRSPFPPTNRGRLTALSEGQAKTLS